MNSQLPMHHPKKAKTNLRRVRVRKSKNTNLMILDRKKHKSMRILLQQGLLGLQLLDRRRRHNHGLYILSRDDLRLLQIDFDILDSRHGQWFDDDGIIILFILHEPHRHYLCGHGINHLEALKPNNSLREEEVSQRSINTLHTVKERRERRVTQGRAETKKGEKAEGKTYLCHLNSSHSSVFVFCITTLQIAKQQSVEC